MIASAALVPTLASVAAVIATCMAAGSAVGRGDDRWPGADMLVGMGLLGGVLTILAVATPVPLSGLMIALGLLSIVAVAVRRHIPGGRATFIALALLSPILLAAAGNQATLYDEFWHWLPSAAYDFTHNSLAKRGLPPSFSQFPGYPQAMPLMIAAASQVAGRFLEAAGPVINVALLAGAGALLADAVAAARQRQGLAAGGKPLLLVAAAVAVTVPLNPGLDGSVVLSSYADCATMVAVGALGLIGVEMLARVAARGSGDAEVLAWRFGLVAALLVNLKQANPVLLALIAAGLAAIAWRDPAISKHRALALLPRMLGPSMVVFVAWRWYVARHVPLGEPSFRPFATWSFQAVPAMVAAVWDYITEAPLFHAMMWTVAAAGLVVLFRCPRQAGEARWLAVVAAVVWLGYNAFLVAVYLGAFSSYEAQTAADYWRYTPHVALLALYAPVMALATVRWPSGIKLRRAASAPVTVAVVFGTLPARGDLSAPHDRTWARVIRGATTDMRRTIPAGSKVAIAQCWNGSPFGMMVRYDLWQFGDPAREIHGIVLADTDDGPDPAVVAGLATRGEAQYLLIQDGECAWDEEDTDKIGLSRIDHEIALFAWRDGAWNKVQSWPIPVALLHRDP